MKRYVMFCIGAKTSRGRAEAFSPLIVQGIGGKETTKKSRVNQAEGTFSTLLTKVGLSEGRHDRKAIGQVPSGTAKGELRQQGGRSSHNLLYVVVNCQ